MILSLLLLFFEVALAVFLVGISVHDIRQHIIKNNVLLWMLPFAAGRAVVNSIIAISGGAVWYHPILSHIGGAVFAFLLFLIVAMIFGGIGGGDIKLAGVLGLAAGFFEIVAALILGLVAASVAALIQSYIYKTRTSIRRLRRFSRQDSLRRSPSHIFCRKLNLC
ncbi:MAG: prepilin peptidase [Clostridia bacterium]|nr:prepilin peptidase [Clostridia bacterium]